MKDGGSLWVSNHRHHLHFKFPAMWMCLQFLQLTTMMTPSIMCSSNHHVQKASFSFEPFASGDNLLRIGDAFMSSYFTSVLLNSHAFIDGQETQRHECGRFVYGDSIPLRSSSSSSSSSSVASFSTSFTFSITGRNSAGFAFMFVNNKTYSGSAGASMCLLNKTRSGRQSNHMFAVEFDTWLNPEFGDPSNNHIGVNLNSMSSEQTYNLCADSGQNETTVDCNYFDTGQDFTSWIDYDGTIRKLEVRLANGSSIAGVAKPSDPLLTVSNLDLSEIFYSDMYVGFSGSVGMFGEVHEIKSWSFQSSLLVSDDEKNAIGSRQVALIVAAMGMVGASTMVVLVGLVCLLKKRKMKEEEEKDSLEL